MLISEFHSEKQFVRSPSVRSLQGCRLNIASTAVTTWTSPENILLGEKNQTHIRRTTLDNSVYVKHPEWANSRQRADQGTRETGRRRRRGCRGLSLLGGVMSYSAIRQWWWSWGWWRMPRTLLLGRLRQEGHPEFEDCIMRSWLKQTNKNKVTNCMLYKLYLNWKCLWLQTLVCPQKHLAKFCFSFRTLHWVMNTVVAYLSPNRVIN